MLDDSFYFTELSEILESVEKKQNLDKFQTKELISELYSLFYNFVYHFLQNQKQYFPSNYSRIIFLINNFQINPTIKNKLLFVYTTFSRRYNKTFSKNSILELISSLGDIFAYFLNKKKPEKFNFDLKDELFTQIDTDKYLDDYNEHVNFYKIIVNKVSKENNVIICFCNQNEIEIECTSFWNEIPKIVSSGTILNCIALTKLDDNHFQTNETSLIVIQPDYLFDVTDISQCFAQKGSNAYFYFINKYFPKKNTYYTFLGNLVNQIFDNLLIDENPNFEEIFDKSIAKKILPFLVLKQKDPSFIASIKNELKVHFSTLILIADKLKQYQFQIEPTFFSAEYGLIGRMDVLLERTDVKEWKTIIELKSGNPPDNLIKIILENGRELITSMWASHYAQIIGYNLLLDSTFPKRIGSSMILYSKDKNKPLREASKINELKRQFIKARNWVFLLEMQLSKGKFQIFDTIQKMMAENINFFNLKNYLDILYSSSPEVNILIKEYIRFLLNENIISKVGDNPFDNRPSQSSLWNLPFEEKSDFETTIIDLKLIKEKSDFHRFYLFFERTTAAINLCSLRKGDPVILYHPNFIQNQLSFQLFKGVIKQIEPEFVVISLRNKFSENNLFEISEGWIVEQDFIDSNLRYLYHSLFNFLILPEEKIIYLLGKRPPEKKFELPSFESFEQYQEIIKNAIEMHPYFLIIGPPGTGKTRIIVKELLRFYLFKTNFKILVCTYTNRAVDEIVDILSKENLKDYYIRIGTKEASDFKENLLSNLVEELSPEKLEDRILRCRIFLGTAFSFLTNSEIFELNNFEIAIIDEASQLLFPHIIGILSKVNKFILVGDEKQLPAVILQNNLGKDFKNKELSKLGYEDLSMSYFEFLLRCNKKNSWRSSIGILNQQSRMHPSLLEPINNFFYQGIIETNPKRKTKSNVDEILNYICTKFNLNVDKRIFFINTPTEKSKKLNLKQAMIISEIINESFNKFDKIITKETFGVISPFRIQNSEIYSRINNNFRTKVLIDTIERFQGSEREIILLSLPFNRSNEIIFSSNFVKLEDGKIIDRKLNVALSRAKELLLIFGNYFLLSQTEYYKDFLKYLLDETNIISIG